MPVRYATLAMAEAELNASGSGSANSAEAEILFAHLDTASRRVEEFCRRRFDRRVETRIYDARGRHIIVPNIMDLGEDLFELSTLTNGDGAVIDSTNIVLAPYNEHPKDRIILTGGLRWTWIDTPCAALQVSGLWGYHTRPAQAWQSAGVTLAAELAADATAWSLAALGSIERGHTLKIDSEQVSVEAITGAGPYTLTLERGVNGTTSALHETGAVVYCYVPEATIQRATARVAAWMYRQRDAPFAKVVTPAGEVVIPPGLPADVQYMLKNGRFVRRSGGVLFAV